MKPELHKYRFINTKSLNAYHVEYMSHQEATDRNELNARRLGEHMKYVLEDEYLRMVDPNYKNDVGLF